MCSAELIGERFEVRLDRTLGTGGFGTVFFALDRSASQTLGVAAKRGSAAELRAEARMLEQVAGHPSVIGLIAFEEVPGGTAFLFLEISHPFFILCPWIASLAQAACLS